MKATNGKVEFNAVARPKLPKKGNGTVLIKVNGVAVEAKVTSNAKWAKGADTLEYIWLPEPKPTAKVAGYFVTLGYNEPAAKYKGTNFVLSEGAATRADPKRLTTNLKGEADRIAKFRDTYLGRKAAALVSWTLGAGIDSLA